MIKPTRSDPASTAQMPLVRNESAPFQREQGLFNDGKGKSKSGTKEFGEGNRHAGARQGDSGAAMSQRSTLFTQHLLDAGALWSRHGGGAHSGDDGDSETGNAAEVVHVLFESAPLARSEGPVAAPPQAMRQALDDRVERVFAQVSMQVTAAIRPGPQVTSGPINISIPTGEPGSGLSQIDIAIGDGLVTVKLCLPGVPVPGDASQQLLAAASQLGQLLQTHLPGRRIKIVQASTAPGAAQDEPAPVAGRAITAAFPFGRLAETDAE